MCVSYQPSGIVNQSPCHRSPLYASRARAALFESRERLIARVREKERERLGARKSGRRGSASAANKTNELSRNAADDKADRPRDLCHIARGGGCFDRIKQFYFYL